MNIQNISALSSQLKRIGFENMDYPLMKRICLAPDNFFLIAKYSKMPHLVSFHFYFESTVGNELYDLIYYDASLHQENSFANTNIEGINIQQLDEQMNQVEWITVFNFSKHKPISLEDKSSFEAELNVHQILSKLHELEKTETGKIVSITLKQKYWSEIPYLELMGQVSAGKGKSDISQRFYFSEDQPMICADEAFRFLLNRQIEKQRQIQKKRAENYGTPEHVDDRSSAKNLLKKRSITSKKTSTKNTPPQ